MCTHKQTKNIIYIKHLFGSFVDNHFLKISFLECYLIPLCQWSVSSLHNILYKLLLLIHTQTFLQLL